MAVAVELAAAADLAVVVGLAAVGWAVEVATAANSSSPGHFEAVEMEMVLCFYC